MAKRVINPTALHCKAIACMKGSSMVCVQPFWIVLSTKWHGRTVSGAAHSVLRYRSLTLPSVAIASAIVGTPTAMVKHKRHARKVLQCRASQANNRRRRTLFMECPFRYGSFTSCPISILSGSVMLGLHFLISSTVVPWLLAISPNVSPCFTR